MSDFTCGPRLEQCTCSATGPVPLSAAGMDARHRESLARARDAGRSTPATPAARRRQRTASTAEQPVPEGTDVVEQWGPIIELIMAAQHKRRAA